MTLPAATPRRLQRQPGRGPLLGVATAIAEHVGVRPSAVRAAFVVLAFAGGLGAVLYGAYFIVLPAAPGSRPRPRTARVLEIVLAVFVAAVCVSYLVTTLPHSNVLLPIALAVLGGALIWRQASDTERGRLLGLSRTSLVAGDRVGRLRLVAGTGLVVTGAIVMLARADISAVRDGLVAVVVTLVGVALLTGPWWMRMVTQLNDERSERIRTQERADIAAHLHDSVLQTLALIQRNADSPREVARLARGQERELRTLLYASPLSGRFGAQVRAAAGEVEDAYGISVDVVVVGDAALDDGLAALAAAAREALVNAARHSGVDTVSLYAEVEDDEVTVFVKDRGVGFDLDAVADDRQGVRGSIIGRVERHGGEARFRTANGGGTEVQLSLPRTARVDS